MTKRVLFRCDASLAIGSGHVMRCRNLARALRRRGAEVLLICRQQPGALIDQLSKEFAVLTLASLPASRQAIDRAPGRELYAGWLGCSQEADADACLLALADDGAGPFDWIVVDHYGIDQIWEQRICAGLSACQARAPRLLAVDDLADRVHHADALLDANRLDACARKRYEPLCPTDCHLFLGPGYAPLDPLYPQLQPLAPQRRSLRRLLIFYGGVDQGNDTALALEALSHPQLSQLEVDVVLGPQAPHHSSVQRLVEQRPHTRLHRGLSSLAGLFLRADLALGAAGTASWERAALALPTLVTPVAQNQLQGARALAASGAALLVPLQSVPRPRELLTRLILHLQECPERLSLLSDAARSLGDGRGLGRLVTFMLGPCCHRSLRPACLADELLYHGWANDPEVRRQSFCSDPIAIDQHQTWFRPRLQSSLSLLQVLVDGDGLPLGQIRFERDPAHPHQAVIGFSLDPVARGHGLASELLRLGLAELTRQWGPSMEAYAEVRAANEASAKAFLRVGFMEGATPRPGVRCFTRPALAPH